MPPISRALISVFDKTGLVPFAGGLVARGVTLLSTGGTARALRAAGLPVTDVADVTGFPEMLDGRVKTLHPRIHAGILAVRDNPEHLAALRAHDIAPIDLVVVNLYPFTQTVSRPDVTREEAIENIDIGGPSMVRAAAKNWRDVLVVVNPARYDEVLARFGSRPDASDTSDASDQGLSETFRLRLMREAFAHTAAYDTAIANYFEEREGESDVARRAEFLLALPRVQALRYGENPHQHAALFGDFASLCSVFHGKEMSYNNILDVTAAVRLTAEFERPTVAIIKHTNPCGVASHDDLVQAWRDAFATDTAAPFGGIVVANRPVDARLAEALNAIFLEIIVAPAFTEDALVLLRKKKDRRLVRVALDAVRARRDRDVRSVLGGVLVQDADRALLDPAALRAATDRQPTPQEMGGLIFAWTVAKHVKSNAIVFAREERTLGVGAGQMSRVDAVRLAVWKAQEMGLDLRGSVVASDAYFPFADNIEALSAAGATAVIQPGGSVRDADVIAAANAHNVAMMFTGMRHFRH